MSSVPATHCQYRGVCCVILYEDSFKKYAKIKIET